MGKYLLLPPHLRKKLKKPLGRVIGKIKELALSEEKIICVGDKASEEILKKGLLPKICIYDGKIGRKEVGISPLIKNFKAQKLEVKNPSGKLNKEVFKKISQGLNSANKTKIYVKGEEDLSALAAIHLSPLSYLVFYGQPDEGLVKVTINPKIKKKVREILKEMEEDENRNLIRKRKSLAEEERGQS